MSNVVDKLTNRPLGEGLVKRIVIWEGRKVRSYIIVLVYLRICIVSMHTVECDNGFVSFIVVIM